MKNRRQAHQPKRAYIDVQPHFSLLRPKAEELKKLLEVEEEVPQFGPEGSRWLPLTTYFWLDHHRLPEFDKRDEDKRTRALQAASRKNLVFPTHAIPRLLQQMRSLGYMACLAGDLAWLQQTFEVSPNVLGGMAKFQLEFASGIQRHRHGLFPRINTQYDHKLVLTALQMYPEETIIIAVPTKVERDRWAESLHAAEHQPLVLTPQRTNDSFRLAVCTYATLEYTHPCLSAIVIVPGAERATCSVFARAWRGLHNCRFYGMVSPVSLTDEHLHRRLELLFGPVFEEVDRPGDQRPRPNVVLVESPRPRSRVIGDALNRKRLSLWANRRRNLDVIRVGQALAHGCAALWGDSCLAAENALQQLPQPRVAIVVESKEHGRNLCALDSNLQLLAQGDEQLLASPRRLDRGSTLPPVCVITTTLLRGATRLPFEIIVRADGGGESLDLAKLQQAALGSLVSVQLIVDFVDSKQRRRTSFADLTASARERVQSYREFGCLVEGPAWCCAEPAASNQARQEVPRRLAVRNI